MEKLTVEAFYSEATKRGVLLGLRCINGHVTVPPRHTCRICHSAQLSVVELSGEGRIISLTVVHTKSKEFPLETPYVLGLVQLEEGGTLLGIVNDAASRIGSRVRVRFKKLSPDDKAESWPRIFFESI